MTVKPEHIQVFPKGHNLYPNGSVFVTDENGTTEYTLDEWAALQNSQQ